MFKKIYNEFSDTRTDHKVLTFLSCIVILSYPSGPFLPDLFLSIMVIYFIYIFKKKNLSLNIDNSIFYFFIILFSYLILRSLFTDMTLFSLKSSLFYFRFFLFSVCIFFLLKKFETFKEILYATIFVILVFVVFDTYIQFFTGKDIFGFSHPDARLSGPFDEELIVGSYLAKITPFMFAIYFSYKKDLTILQLILLLITYVLVFLSGERTSFFYFSFFIFIFFIFYDFKDKKKYFLIFLISIILLLGVAFQKETVKTRMIEDTFCSMNINFFDLSCPKNKFDEQTINSNRIIIFSTTHEGHYKSAFKMFKNNIIFGVGPKMFRFNCDKEKYKNEYSCSTHPHNTLLQILAELGIVGFIFYLLLAIYLIKNFINFVFINKKILDNHRISIILIYVSFFQTFFFLVPSGQFFNNYISIASYMPLGLFLYYINLYK